MGTRKLLRTFRRLSDVGNRQEVAFSLCRKLAPASLLQLPILVGTLGDRTLAWRVGAHNEPQNLNTAVCRATLGCPASEARQNGIREGYGFSRAAKGIEMCLALAPQVRLAP